jgi:hypothetical protein
MVNVGADLHKTQFTVCVQDGNGDQFSQYLTTEAGYEAFLGQMASEVLMTISRDEVERARLMSETSTSWTPRAV